MVVSLSLPLPHSFSLSLSLCVCVFMLLFNFLLFLQARIGNTLHLLPLFLNECCLLHQLYLKMLFVEIKQQLNNWNVNVVRSELEIPAKWRSNFKTAGVEEDQTLWKEDKLTSQVELVTEKNSHTYLQQSHVQRQNSSCGCSNAEIKNKHLLEMNEKLSIKVLRGRCKQKCHFLHLNEVDARMEPIRMQEAFERHEKEAN